MVLQFAVRRRVAQNAADYAANSVGKTTAELRAHEVFRKTDGVLESRDIPVPLYSRIARGTSS